MVTQLAKKIVEPWFNAKPIIKITIFFPENLKEARKRTTSLNMIQGKSWMKPLQCILCNLSEGHPSNLSFIQKAETNSEMKGSSTFQTDTETS